MTYSSEIIKVGLFPNKEVNEMTDKELFEFRNKFDPDIMGFDGKEGMEMEDNETNSKQFNNC